MARVTSPHTADEASNIYTEGINYFDYGDTSIWGTGDQETLNLLSKKVIRGHWLNLAAGDGRYNNILLSKADKVTAADIDKSALSKLTELTPAELKPKLETKTFDITKVFPFEDAVFDGVLHVGTLHLFTPKIITAICAELKRVVKPKSTIIIDFATDIKRVQEDGSFFKFNNEPDYDYDQGMDILLKNFQGFQLEFIEGNVPREKVSTRGTTYDFSCRFVLMCAQR